MLKFSFVNRFFAINFRRKVEIQKMFRIRNGIKFIDTFMLGIWKYKRLKYKSKIV